MKYVVIDERKDGTGDLFNDEYSNLDLAIINNKGGSHMNKERVMYLACRALNTLIYGGVSDYDTEEMKEWVKNEFDMTDEEFDELGL